MFRRISSSNFVLVPFAHLVKYRRKTMYAAQPITIASRRMTAEAMASLASWPILKNSSSNSAKFDAIPYNAIYLFTKIAYTLSFQ